MKCSISLLLALTANVFGNAVGRSIGNQNLDSSDSLIMCFDSLNSNQFDKALGHPEFKDIPKTDEALQPINELTKEAASGEGKLDLGSDSGIDSEVLIAVSKDSTTIGGLHKSEPHQRWFFQNGGDPKSPILSSYASSHTAIAKYSIGAYPSIAATADQSPTIAEQITERPTSSDIFLTPTRTFFSSQPETSDVNSPVQQPLDSLKSIPPDVEQYTKDPRQKDSQTSMSESVTTTSLADLEIIAKRKKTRLEQDNTDMTERLTDDSQKINIEKTIKETLERLWKENSLKHAVDLTNSETDHLESITPAESTPTSTSLSYSFTSTSVITNKIPEPITIVSMVKPSMTPEPIATELQSMPIEQNDGIDSIPLSDFNVKNYINDRLGKEATDLNVEKLKKIFDILLQLQNGGNLTPSIEDPKLQVSDSDITKGTSVSLPTSKTDLEEVGSIEPQILQISALQESADAPRNTEQQGSFLNKLKKIPQNIFDLVEEKYGDEYREKSGGIKSSKRRVEKMPNETGNTPKKKKIAKAKLNEKVNPVEPDESYRKRTSLNKTLKDKNMEKPSDAIAPVGDEDEDYRRLSEGKVVFGFDKKAKIGLKKSKNYEKEPARSEANPAEIEYYEPEKFLFGKSSTSVDKNDLTDKIVSNEDDFEGSEVNEEGLGRVPNQKDNQVTNDNAKVANGTNPKFEKGLKLLNKQEASTQPMKKSSKHNDPYAIPKVPVDQLERVENLPKESIDKASPLSGTRTVNPSADKTMKDSLDKFRKNPSLLFLKDDDPDSSFDFTKSEANSIKFMSWSIMGAAILIATSVVLV